MINNQFTNDVINKLKENEKELDNLKEELQKLFSNEYIFQAIETTKHDKYFLNADFNKNLVTGSLDLKEVSKILSANLLSVEQKNSLQPNQEETIINEEETINKEEDDISEELEETTTSGFESTMKWVIVAGIVVGLFIIIFLIIKKNNNKMNNLAKLSTNIKYVSTLSDDSITSSIVDLGTEL